MNDSVKYNIPQCGCLLKNIIIQSNDNSMDRLFGRQISNLLDPLPNNKVRYLGRVHSQLSRSTSQDPAKMQMKRFNRSIVGQNPVKQTKKEDLSDSGTQQQKVEMKDVQIVEEYFDDCFKFMMSQQAKNHKLKNYMDQQLEINQKMRGILLDWLIDLHHKYKMFPQTLYITTMIIDKYLSKKSATKENLQLIGTAAFYIAAKYEEVYHVPELDELVHFAAKTCTKNQIIKMQADIINTLQFNLIMETSFKFFEPLAKVCKMDPKNFHLAQYVLEMALLQANCLDYKPSLMASSAIYLINKIRKRSEAWPTQLQSLTGYSQKELKHCAKDLCSLLQRADELPNAKSLRKKFSLTQYHEVTHIKQRKKQ